MYGWRGRIGLINSANNTVLEPEFAAILPEGVNSYCTRIAFRPTISGLKAMINHVEEAAGLLSSEGICDLIVFGCTMGSMIGGVGYDKELISIIERVAKVPAITITTAVLAAFEALGVRRIAIATPYTKDIGETQRTVLTDSGYQVTEIKNYHEDVPPEEFTNEMIGRLSPAITYRLARAVDNNRAQAIFITCANFRANEIIDLLEQDTGKPVITSNQASAWLALRRMGIRDSIKGFGRLLENY